MYFRDEEKIRRDQYYLTRMNPLFYKDALFSDTTKNYVDPEEPNPYGQVTISFRTARSNVDRVFAVIEGERLEMKISGSDKTFDYYSVKYTLSDAPIHYYFYIESGKIKLTYDAAGPNKSMEPGMPFKITPGYHTPKWARGAVMYQIYTERFCNGDPTNDVESGEYFYTGGQVTRVDDWSKVPAVDGTKEFYGGDLQGVLNKLDYLEDLGVDCIYFNPLFVSPSNHKYDTQDYEHIDPHFGKIVKDGGECLSPGERDNRQATKYKMRVCSKENLEASDELFRQVVEEAHKRGIKVILDGVFNHCGSFNKWLDRELIYEGAEGFEPGAYAEERSPYHNFFDFRGSNDWPYNKNYDGWWGYDTLPKLNYEASQALYDKIIEIAQKWVSAPYNVDGWRLDVAADLGHSPDFNHEFFRRLRRAVKEANPEALILAEHYGDPSGWLNGKEWDSVMNYDGFMEPVTWFLTGMQKHSDDFRFDMVGNAESFFNSMLHAGYGLSNPALQVAMNELSNHDHSRFLTRTNQRVGRTNSLGAHAADEGVDMAVMRQAVVMQMTWPGAPTIYYGDEAGLTGFTDPDNRRTYPWGHENTDLINFHKEMIRIHKANRELIDGSVIKLVSDYGLLSYGRFTRKHSTIVIINRSNDTRYLPINIWRTICVKGVVFERIMYSDREGYNTTPVEIIPNGGRINMELPPVCAIVICTRHIDDDKSDTDEKDEEIKEN